MNFEDKILISEKSSFGQGLLYYKKFRKVALRFLSPLRALNNSPSPLQQGLKASCSQIIMNHFWVPSTIYDTQITGAGGEIVRDTKATNSHTEVVGNPE